MSTSTPEESIATLQRFVDGYAADVDAARLAAFDESVPAPARRLMVGALNYVLDTLDMFPDHYKGLGVADDAMVLRLAAAQAAAAGAQNDTIARLAGDVDAIRAMFSGLAADLDRFVSRLPDRSVRGRTADQVLGNRDVRTVFEADLGREVARYQPAQIDTSVLGAQAAVKELEKMIAAALKRAG